MPRGKPKKVETTKKEVGESKKIEKPESTSDTKEEVVSKEATRDVLKEESEKPEMTLKIEIPEEMPTESKRQKKSKKRIGSPIQIVTIKELTEEISNMRKELEECGWMCKALTNEAILSYVLKIYQSLNVWQEDSQLFAKPDLELSDKKIAAAGEDLQDAIRGFEDDDEDSEFQQICEDIFAPLFKYAPDYAHGSDVEDDGERSD